MIQLKNSKPTAFEFKPFSLKQQKLINWWRAGSKYNSCDMIVVDGSIRAGKTIAEIVGFLQWSFEFSNESFIIGGKTTGSLKRNVIKPMLQILTTWNIGYLYNRSENFIEIGSNTYYLFGGNNEASQDSVQGLTAAGCLLDEAALMPQSFIEQCIGRCSVEGAKIWMNCNPGNPGNFVKKELIDKRKEKNIYYLHFTMDDNLTLSAKKKRFYERMYTGIFRKRYILGLWVAADGSIYQTFADYEDEFLITDEEIKEKNIMYCTIGVDFGGTKSGHSFTCTAFTSGYKEVITVKEWYKKQRIDVSVLTQDFINFVRECQAQYGNVYEAYCDSAEQTIIAEFEAAVIKNHVVIDVKSAIKGPINDRIAFYNSIMSQRRYRINKNCTATRDALKNAVYDDKKKTEDVRLDDGSTNIDSLDSLEYTTESVQADIIYKNIA